MCEDRDHRAGRNQRGLTSPTPLDNGRRCSLHRGHGSGRIRRAHTRRDRSTIMLVLNGFWLATPKPTRLVASAYTAVSSTFMVKTPSFDLEGDAARWRSIVESAVDGIIVIN